KQMARLHARDHAQLGDGAVCAVLDAVERVRPPRWMVRIEHAEVIDAADVPRFAELGVIASVQPCHLLVDIEALGRALPDRVDRVLPLRELIDSGLEPGQTLLFGSDAPIVRPDPEDSIRAAVHRSRPDSVAIAPDQAISESEAWSCFDAGRQMPAIGEA
ncbi:MAG: amidohydrolase family protein, partial [Planctomycetota bacterium]